jgi:hypothetical protein
VLLDRLGESIIVELDDSAAHRKSRAVIVGAASTSSSVHLECATSPRVLAVASPSTSERAIHETTRMRGCGSSGLVFPFGGSVRDAHVTPNLSSAPLPEESVPWSVHTLTAPRVGRGRRRSALAPPYRIPSAH